MDPAIEVTFSSPSIVTIHSATAELIVFRFFFYFTIETIYAEGKQSKEKMYIQLYTRGGDIYILC